MAKLQDLLANNDPETLKALLAGRPINPQLQADTAPPQPTTAPTPTSSPDMGPTPVSPTMLGMDPQASQNPIPDLMSKQTPAAPPSGQGPVADPKAYAAMQEGDDDTGSSSTKLDQSGSVSSKGPGPSEAASALQSLISGPQGFNNNTVANLQAAQDQAKKERNNADLLEASTHALSGVIGNANHSGTPSTAEGDKFFEGQKKEADQGVTDFQARGEKEKDDPASAASVSMREFAKPLMAKLGIQIPDNVSFNQMEKISPQLTKLYDAKQTDETNRLKAQELMETRRMHDQLLISDRKDKSDAKATNDQNKAYTDLRKNLETFRGNSGAQQAAKDVLSADKALAIVKNKDPNKLTTQDLSLLAGEMAKIATGGVPTEHGLQQLLPSNLQTKFAEMQNFLLSKPSDANAAAYIKKNMSYLDEMRNIANQTLGQYKANIARGYMGRISDDQKDELLSDYPEMSAMFKKGTNVKTAEPEMKTPGAAQSKPTTVMQNGHTYTLNPKTGEYE